MITETAQTISQFAVPFESWSGHDDQREQSKEVMNTFAYVSANY
jgi:hypothetical protein